MNEKEKEAVALMLKESQETLNALQKLIEENTEIPEDAKKKALQELEKTRDKVEKTITKR